MFYVGKKKKVNKNHANTVAEHFKNFQKIKILSFYLFAGKRIMNRQAYLFLVNYTKWNHILS